MSLQGKLVEIYGLKDLLQPAPGTQTDPNAQALDVNGCRGWAVEWRQDDQRYQVESFDGDSFSISEENLREYVPPKPQAGGFDVAWPAMGLEVQFEVFAEEIVKFLVDRSFCLIQMTNVTEQSKLALMKAFRMEWSRIVPEFETDFLGHGSLAKISWLPQEAAMEADALSQADGVLTTLASMLAPYSEAMGFVAGNRSAGLLRMPFEDDDEETSLMRGLDESGLVNGRELEGCIQFGKLKKIGLIYFLHGAGGTLKLNFHDSAVPSVEIPIEQGRVLLFRHDLMHFSYDPKGSRSLALQAWIFREERPGEVALEARAASDLLEGWDVSKIPAPPVYANSNETVDCMSLTARLAGEVGQGEDYWQLLFTSADGIIQCPISRWDQNLYHDAETFRDTGKMYTDHFAFVEDTWLWFDCDYFGIPKDTAEFLDPVGRKALEVAMETVHRGGWTSDTLRDTNMGFFCGGAGSDGWYQMYMTDTQVPKTTEGVMLNHRQSYLFERIPYTLGLRGPCQTADTACSSGLVATAMCHSHMRPRLSDKPKVNFNTQLPYGLCMGASAILTPFFTAGLCGAGMLTHEGRCFTFDKSADGYCRGEGNSAMYYEVNTKEELSRFMCLQGSSCNQDGKSASLTAPNGPSQTQVAKQSLKEAGITAFDIQSQELHGTGTPLGDPIEVGALRACMMNSADGKTRSRPLIKTSSKSAIAHGEMNAGLAGIMKCTLMLKFQAYPGGLHIFSLNANMDTGGYPVIFNAECVDSGAPQGYCGVSSFGFSGCNARGDIWGMATAGHRQVVPVGFDFSADRHKLGGERIFKSAGRPTASANEAASKKLRGLDGVVCPGPINDDTILSFSGTWNAWSTMDEMEKVPELRGDTVCYQCGFRIGETLVEEFCIYVNNYADNNIFPASRKAGQDCVVLGPGTAPKDYNWRIDGRAEGAHCGTVYVVSLWWYPQTHRKRVSWEMVHERLEFPWPLHSFTHRYNVKGTWTSWYCQDMMPIGEDSYETVFRIGVLGTEEFQFTRDRDEAQTIYPTYSTTKKTSLPIRGPDGNGRGKHWIVAGETGDTVRLRLTINDGRIIVCISLRSGAERIWESLPVGSGGRFYVADYDGRCKMMSPSSENPKVQQLSVTTTESDGFYFRILVDEDPSQAIYPEMNGAAVTGLTPAVGPDEFGQDLFWIIPVPEGSRAQIRYDPTQADRRNVVTWSVEWVRTIEDSTPIGIYREDADELDVTLGVVS